MLAVVLEHCRKLDDLVYVDQNINGQYRQFQNERRDQTNGNGDTPHGDAVTDKAEFGIAAGCKDAGDHRHVDRLSDDIVGADHQHHTEIAFGGICQSGEQRRKGDHTQNNHTGDHASKNRSLGKLSAVFLCLFQFALSQQASHHNAACGGNAGAEADDQILDDVGNGVCGCGIAAHVSHNDGVHGEAQSPHQFVTEDRGSVFPEVPQQHLVRTNRPAQPDLYAVFLHHDQQCPCQFNDLGDNCCNGGTGDTHFREKADTENKGCIQNDIDDYGNGTDDCTQNGVAAVLQNAQVDLRNAEQQIGNAHYPQIFCTVCDQHRIRCKCPHQLFRKERCTNGERQGQQNGECQSNAQCLFHGTLVADPPVLCGENGNAGSNGKQEQGIYELDLSGEGYCRESVLTDKTQHKCV